MASNLGKVFVELSLDDKVFKQKLGETLTSTQTTAKGIETAWKALGTHSEETFERQRRAAENSYTLIKNYATSTANDIIRAEEAKARKIAEIDAQQRGMVDRHSNSIGGMVGNMMKLYGAYFVVSMGVHAFTSAISKSMDIVDEYNTSTVKLAAMMTGMRTDGGDLSGKYQQSSSYAKALNETLKQVDANTILTFRDLQQITEEMMKQGVVMNVNKREQVDAFTQISNALAVISAGAPNKEIQLRQEIRALLQGELRDTDQLSKMLASQVPNLKQEIQLHKQKGDILEWLGQQLSGFAAAQKDINALWITAKSTMQTIAEEILRGGMEGAYKNIIAYTHQLGDWVKQHKPELVSMISDIMKVLEIGITAVTAPIIKAAEVAIWLKKQTMPENNQNVLAANITSLEGLRADAVKKGRGTADIDYQLRELRSKQNWGSYMDLPDIVTPPNIKTLPDNKAAKAGQDWVEIQRRLTAELEKSGVETSKWDDKLIAINKEYQDILDKGKGIGGETAVPVNKAFMDKWRAGMIANVDADRMKEMAKITAEGEQKERDHQNAMSRIYLEGTNAVFSIEKQNQMKLAQLKATWGVNTEKEILEMERDYNLSILDQELKDATRHFAAMGEQAGLYTAKSVEEQQQLQNKIDKILAQRATTEEWFNAQSVERQRKANIAGLEALKQVYSYIPGATENMYEVELALIAQRANTMKASGVDQVALAKWVAMEQEKAWSDSARKSSSVLDGMSAGFADYARNAERRGQHMADVVTKSLDSISDAFAEMVVEGKADFESLVKSIEKDLLRLAMKDFVIGPLAGLLGLSGSSGGSTQGGMMNMSGGLIGMAAKYLGSLGGTGAQAGYAEGAYSTYGNDMAQGAETWSSTMDTSAGVAATNITDSSKTFSSTITQSGQAFGDGMAGMVPMVAGGIMMALGLSGGNAGMSTGGKMLSGAMAGAMMGSYFGPWGMAAGAVIGAAASMFHTGGVIGSDSTPSKTVPASTFFAAPRAHGGLGPGERAIIAKDDEGIFTPGQMKALGGLARNGGGGNTYHVHVSGNVWALKDLSRELKRIERSTEKGRVH